MAKDRPCFRVLEKQVIQLIPTVGSSSVNDAVSFSSTLDVSLGGLL